MRDKRTALWVAMMITVAAGPALFAATRQRIESHWRDGAVVIDGDHGEWAGPLRPVDEKLPIVIAAMNDGQFLYLVLSTSDLAARRQIMRQGLIVWFDPSGGDKKHFGVKFPVGVLSVQPDRLEPTNRLEVYGPEKDEAHSFVTEMAPGIAVKVGEVQSFFVYELKVPLARSTEWPYAIEAKPGTLIGLGLETPKIERPSREGPGGTGGFGGRGGRMGGRRGAGGNDGQFEPPKPLKTWATIQLAAR